MIIKRQLSEFHAIKTFPQDSIFSTMGSPTQAWSLSDASPPFGTQDYHFTMNYYVDYENPIQNIRSVQYVFDLPDRFDFLKPYIKFEIKLLSMSGFITSVTEIFNGPEDLAVLWKLSSE